MKKPQNFAAIIRAAITASGKTQLALSESTGVPQPRISLFMAGGSVRLEHASKLSAAVGLRLEKR